MTVKQAHVVLLLLDALVFAACYWCFGHILSVARLVSEGASHVAFERSLLYFPFTLVIPVLHLLSIAGLKNVNRKLANKTQSIVVIVVVVIAAGFKFQVTSMVEELLSSGNYQMCETVEKGRYYRASYQKEPCRL